MAVYFDQRLETDLTAIKTDISWHKIFPLLATAVYVEDQGGTVQIFQEEVKFNILFILLNNLCDYIHLDMEFADLRSFNSFLSN